MCDTLHLHLNIHTKDMNNQTIELSDTNQVTSNPSGSTRKVLAPMSDMAEYVGTSPITPVQTLQPVADTSITGPVSNSLDQSLQQPDFVKSYRVSSRAPLVRVVGMAMIALSGIVIFGWFTSSLLGAIYLQHFTISTFLQIGIILAYLTLGIVFLVSKNKRLVNTLLVTLFIVQFVGLIAAALRYFTYVVIVFAFFASGSSVGAFVLGLLIVPVVITLLLYLAHKQVESLAV